jgi:hypothetical protein
MEEKRRYEGGKEERKIGRKK